MYKTLAERRHNNVTKALRKRKICKHYGWDYYDNLHQYSKNKIHCSCPLCAIKTNTKYFHGGRHEGKNLSPRYIRIWEMMSQKMKEYTEENYNLAF